MDEHAPYVSPIDPNRYEPTPKVIDGTQRTAMIIPGLSAEPVIRAAQIAGGLIAVVGGVGMYLGTRKGN